MLFFCHVFLLVASLLTLTAASSLATITPCPAAQPGPLNPTPIIVTSQHQPVSTCVLASTCKTGACRDDYIYETWQYVRTLIPCEWNGTRAETTVVTRIDQPITISTTVLTKTIFAPQPTNASAIYWYNATGAVSRSSSTYLTVARNYVAPYNKIGSLAIPGYGGSGLCAECDVNGIHNQAVTVTECTSDPNGPRCVRYVEHWVSNSTPATSQINPVTISISTTLPTTGAYTFVFSGIAPAQTFSDASMTWIAGPHPYHVLITRSCTQAPETIDMVRTVTKTITFEALPSVSTEAVTTACPFPTGPRGFPGFHSPALSSLSSQTTTAPTPNAHHPPADPSPVYVHPASTSSVPPLALATPLATALWGDRQADASTLFSTRIIPSTTTATTIVSSADPHWADWPPRSSSIPPPISSTLPPVQTPISTTDAGGHWGDWPPRLTTSSLNPPSTLTTTSSISCSSTSVPTTTATPGNVGLFYIQLEKLGTRFRRRAPSYIMFDGEDAYLTLDRALAALFYLVDDILYHLGRPVGTTVTDGAAVLELLESVTGAARGWSRNGDDLSFVPARLGFCVTESSSVIVKLTASPRFQCSPYRLHAENQDGTHPTPKASTTASTMRPTTTISASTSHSPDPSADMDDESPLPTDAAFPGKFGHGA